MSTPANNLLHTAIRISGAAPPSLIFNIELWEGDATNNRAIDIGMDFLANTGVVWIKQRLISGVSWLVFDTLRGQGVYLGSNQNAQIGDPDTLEAFQNYGFDIGDDLKINRGGINYVNFSMIETPDFFQIVEFVGDGINGKVIPHTLGGTLGFLLVKKKNSVGRWQAQHRSISATFMMEFDLNLMAVLDSAVWNDTDMTSSNFTVGTDVDTNDNGSAYTCYLFAHNTTPTGRCFCDTYEGSGNNLPPNVPVGWMPQLVIIKNTEDSGGRWIWIDTVRGNLVWIDFTNTQERSDEYITFTATGFTPIQGNLDSNALGDKYIFIAMR